MSLRPRALVHRGHVEACGLCFDARWIDVTELRARVLAHANGATVLALGDVFLVRFAAPRRVDADHCDATPLVADGSCMLALPLRAAERALLDLDRSVPALVRARDGRVLVQPLASAQTVDLAQWLDVDSWTAVPVETLGAKPVVVRAVLIAGAGASEDARTILGDAVPPPARERDALLAALAGDRGSAAGERHGLGWIAGIGRWLGDALASTPQTALPSGTGGGRVAPYKPAPPSALREWLIRMVAGSPIARAIGRRQAAYLGKTLRMFEDGDFDLALRHAIPMSSLPGSTERSSLSVPTPRGELRLEPNARGGSSSAIHIGEEALAHMRTVYRNAARALELAGRFEEAAFVLFELLGNDDAGVAMLERNGKLELAARMAEGRQLAPGSVIRLWFLAGNPAQAVRVARRTGAFADAISRLEHGNTEYAARLRVLWGERLAEAGDFAAAVDAVWPVPQAHGLAQRWLDLAIAFGGPTGARLLPRKLALASTDSATAAFVHDAVLAIVGDDADDGVGLRRILAQAWPASADAGLARTLGRVLCRQLMLDAHADGEPTAAVALRNQLGDPLLAFDGVTPGLVPKPEPRSVRPSLFEAHERGLQSIADVVALPGGRYLLALGELGIRLVDRGGRTLRHYEHPCTQLVLADSGSRVVTMIRRDSPYEAPATLGRIDLVSGKSEPWCDARFIGNADDYDGAEWYLAEDDAIACVDVQAAGLSVLWRIGQLPGRVLAIARLRTRLSFALAHAHGGPVEIWTYHLDANNRRLDRRHPIVVPEGTTPKWAAVSPEGAVVVGLANDPANEARVVSWSPGRGVVETRRRFPITVVARERGAIVCDRDGENGCTIAPLAYESLGNAAPWLTLGGSTSGRVRVQGDRVLVADDRGRVIELDLGGRIVHWLLVP